MLALALWPQRWQLATLLAALGMLQQLDVRQLPEELDRIEQAIEGVFRGYHQPD